MTTDHEQAAAGAAIRADKELLRAAARRLRHEATQAGYRGLRRPDHAYAIASVLDTAELRWSTQDGAVRDELRRCCRTLLDQRTGDAPAADRDR